MGGRTISVAPLVRMYHTALVSGTLRATSISSSFSFRYPCGTLRDSLLRGTSGLARSAIQLSRRLSFVTTRDGSRNVDALLARTSPADEDVSERVEPEESLWAEWATDA